MSPALQELIDRAHGDLARYHQGLRRGVDSDQAADAGWRLHRDITDLLPHLEQLLVSHAQLAAALAEARRDPLTGLSTRKTWTAEAQRLIDQGPAAVLLVDLDRFKPINDRHGHAAGDAILIATAHRLADWAGPAGTAGRLGGDEFVVAVPDHGDLDQQAAKLRWLLTQPVDVDGRALRVGASVGVARLADLPARTVSAAIGAADRAMYRAKGRGRRGRRLRRAIAPIYRAVGRAQRARLVIPQPPAGALRRAA